MNQANRWIGRAVILGVLAGLAAAPLRAEVLITEREAKLPSDDVLARSPFPGPKVVVMSPARDAGAVKSPFDLEIKFEERGGVKIDLNSLAVTYKKIPPVDLTERLKEFVTPDGIVMPAAEVPPGEHKIHIEVTDVDGRTGGAEFSIDVAP